MTRDELQRISTDPHASDEQRERAKELLAMTETTDTGSEYQLAEVYRCLPEPQRMQAFENARRTLKHIAFSVENEARAAREDYRAVFGN